MKMIPKTKIDAENELFYAYNRASRAAVDSVMVVREASGDEAFFGTDEQIAAEAKTEYGQSDAGKAALADLTAKIQQGLIAGMRMGRSDFKAELPRLVKREVMQKKMNKDHKETK